ncbi:FAD-binding domain-containing protein [Sandaracinobacteroides saxicola]|uniref:Cryptochrome/DNA photolyase FAD-binding domain-containing protein n=1 Tax=Sandaracinobacteroides saxicola TaxID=2759707 RepID=A0A7G5IFL0_9SPHN|nr:FAD-binding domain-containing protein [Sandaracinobacteroides saxicola]QMW22152.1 hypothetical protein H3309_12355 [Sandaracinobacteroides saxicola]
MTFALTRAAALERLAAFLPHAGRAYAGTRNLDRGPGKRSNVSELSPAIRRRLITEEEVAKAAHAAHGHTAEKFIAEVCWRSYWRGWLEARPSVWQDYLTQVAAADLDLSRDAGLRTAYADAVNGRTGIDAFDGWARELTDTGYLHNHARMSFASIWIFTLRLPWALGAAHFYRHLLDACPASNTLGWRWVAGLQTPGKTYLARAAIIRDTSCGRFRVEASLATSAPPLAGPPHPAPIPPSRLSPPDPAARTLVWITSEDCTPETLDFGISPLAIVAVDSIGGDPADAKRAAADSALADACIRAEAHFQAPVTRLPEAALLDALDDAATAARATQIVTPYAPVGPVADRIASLTDPLARRGIALRRVLRPWDARAWPHATRGFFAFKPVIPSLLA